MHAPVLSAILLLLSCGAFPAIGCTFPHGGSVGRFHGVRVWADVDVVCHVGPDSVGLIRCADPADTAAVIVSNLRGVLTLQLNSASDDTDIAPIHVYTDTLAYTENSYDRALLVVGRVTGESFHARQTGNGLTSVSRLEAGEVKLSVDTGRGSVTVGGGECRRLSCSVVGTGTIDALPLVARQVSCRFLGGGRILTHPVERLSLFGLGSCRVEYAGTPRISRFWNKCHPVDPEKAHTFSPSDTTIRYPKFLGFCVRTYNWADRTFNSYDPAYVEGTGKRWKARLVSDSWADTYAVNIEGDGTSVQMRNDMYSNVGVFLQYMAVSVGYSVNLNNMFGDKRPAAKRLTVGFNCARFNIDLYYTENTWGTYLRKLGDYNGGHEFKSYFPGLKMHSFGVDAIYFINNRRYSHGAAYNFSKSQLRSAGSIIAGFSYSDQDISLDFTTLPADMRAALGEGAQSLRFHYYNFCAIAGYGYNWVLNPHFLFNVTLIPAIGINRCHEDATAGSGTLLSLNAKARVSLTYNHRSLFAGIQGRMDGSWYTSRRYSLFSSILNLSASLGLRF